MMKKMVFICIFLAALLCWHVPARAAVTYEQALASIDNAMKKIPQETQKAYDFHFTQAEADAYVMDKCYTFVGRGIHKIDSWFNSIFGVSIGAESRRREYEKYLKRLVACDTKQFEERFKGTENAPRCFTCKPVALVISAFLNGCSKAYPVMRTAGKTILGILTALWIAYHFMLTKIISFSEIDPMEYLQELFVFLFKVLIAYVCLSGGLSVIMKYTINPIISFGTDMAIGFLTTM